MLYDSDIGEITMIAQSLNWFEVDEVLHEIHIRNSWFDNKNASGICNICVCFNNFFGGSVDI